MKRITAFIIVILLVAVYTFAPAETGPAGDTADSWICPDCGNSASGNFCSNRGAHKPEDSQAGTAEEETGKEFFYGTWYCTAVIMNGSEIDISSYEKLKLDLVLNEDGTFQINMTDSKPTKGTWEYVSSTALRLEDNTETMEASYADGRLAITMNGNTAVFTKESTGKSGDNDVRIVKASSVNDFYGVWVLDRFSSGGLTLTTMDLHAMGKGISIKMTVSEDTAKMEMKAEGKTNSRTCSTSYENGVLYLRPLFSTTSIAVMFTDSGELTFNMDIEGGTAQVYMIKQE